MVRSTPIFRFVFVASALLPFVAVTVIAEDGLAGPESSPTVSAKKSHADDAPATTTSKTATTSQKSLPSTVAKTVAKTSEPAKLQPQPQLSPEMRTRRDNIRHVLVIYSQQHQNTFQHSPWEIMHGIIAYGVETKLRVGGPGGEPTTAIGWLCYNRRGNGLNLFYTTPEGIGALNGPGLQGHSGQFLAMMAQSKVKVDYPLKINGRDYTLGDLIAYEKRTCMAHTELTFKLIGIVHYQGTDVEWTSQDGQPWSIQRLVKEELAQPIHGATCGGTHRLMGLSYTLYKRAKEGKPVAEQFVRAKKFTEDYRRYAFSMQNDDGSFSTEWFRGPGARHDIARRMQTTGHILEWLVFSMPQEQLSEPKTVAAVDYLTAILYHGQNRQWEVGPLGHAVHALALYDRRMSQPATPSAPAIAKGKKPTSKRVVK